MARGAGLHRPGLARGRHRAFGVAHRRRRAPVAPPAGDRRHAHGLRRGSRRGTLPRGRGGAAAVCCRRPRASRSSPPDSSSPACRSCSKRGARTTTRPLAHLGHCAGRVRGVGAPSGPVPRRRRIVGHRAARPPRVDPARVRDALSRLPLRARRSVSQAGAHAARAGRRSCSSAYTAIEPVLARGGSPAVVAPARRMGRHRAALPARAARRWSGSSIASCCRGLTTARWLDGLGAAMQACETDRRGAGIAPAPRWRRR